MSSELDSMYREVILDHFRSPRGKKPLAQKDISSGGSNPACGDEISVDVQVENDVLKDIHVACQGCAISVASGSMLAEAVKGRSLAEVRILAEGVRRMLKGEEDIDLPEEWEDIEALKGVRQFPVRIKCALLAWVTLLEGMDNLHSGNTGNGKPVSTEDNKDAKTNDH